MANTINPILIDRIYAMGMKALRRKTSLLKYVTRYDREFNSSFQGDTVVVPLPTIFEDDDVEDVVPSNVNPAPANITPGFGVVTLSNWKKVAYALTDKEISDLQAGIFTMQFDAAMDALARTIVRNVWQNYLGVYQFAGTAGVTPFTSNITIAGAARKLLFQAGVPAENRAMILGFDADAEAINLAIFQQYLQAGTTETLREGIIGRASGFDWDTDAYLPSFVGGTLSNGTTKAAITQGARVAGNTGFDLDSPTLTGSLVPGDLFTLANHDQQYVVTSSSVAAGNLIGINFTPGLVVPVPDNTVITFVANHALAAMAMHPQAICFASKPLDNVTFEGGSQIRQYPDPMSGLTVCLEITRQYKQTVAEFSCLWGSSLVRPECAVRILG